VSVVSLWALIGGALALLGFGLRVLVNVGRSPGGVDTWYYLAYADAVRRRPGLDVRLPQYLLQDERQSYPPLFPTLLSLFPRGLLRRHFWAVAPAVDCLHLLLLYWLAYKITGSLVVSALTGCLYAFTPQMVSETRSLNGRSLGALLHSLAVIAALRYVFGETAWPWLPAALLLGAALLLSAATSAAAYGFVCCALSLLDREPRYLLVAAGAVLLATLLSGGHYLRVIRNYVQAVAYWRRNRRRFGAHPVRESPIYGNPRAGPAHSGQRPGFLGQTAARQLLRLLGENPFILALPLAPYGVFPWGPRLFWWAMSLAGLSVAATLLPLLRFLGPGRGYMKTAVLPTAYTLSAGIGTVAGFARPVGIVTLLGLGASVAAIGFFYWYIRNRPSEQTAFLPAGLAEAVARLARAPSGGFFCLPTVYADFACYSSGQPVLWGGHCGDLRRLEAVAPVITRPLPELFREHGVRYVLLETSYTSIEELRLEDQVTELGAWGRFVLCEWRDPARPTGT
jgi:hypothetical protein